MVSRKGWNITITFKLVFPLIEFETEAPIPMVKRLPLLQDVMASTAVHPQSPPRKRARLSLKFIRKEQQPTVPEEPAETESQEPESSQSVTFQ